MLYDIFWQTLNQDEYIQYLPYCTQNVLELNSLCESLSNLLGVPSTPLTPTVL